MKIILAALLLVAAGPAISAGAQTVAPGAAQTTLMVDLESRRSGGRIAVAIFRDADSFRRGEGPVRSLMVDCNSRATRAWVVGLPPGRYAIAAFHDTDGDGKLTTTMGIPREPFGFSNDARGRFGPPAFEMAAFDLPPRGAIQRIALTPLMG